MKYRLKDQDLQAALDCLTRGEFSAQLELFNFTVDTETIALNPIITIPMSDLDKDYDPHEWNEWPGVTPPTHEIMQIEVHAPFTSDGPEVRGGGCIFRGCGKFVAGVWVQNDGLPVPLTKGLRIRFRPWNLGVPK